MGYFVLIIVAVLVFYVWFQGKRSREIKRHGIRARGVIIENKETQREQSNYQLGGNINNPVIRFTIEDGSEITGKPVMPFITQHEVKVPSYINIIYDSRDPQKFIIDDN